MKKILFMIISIALLTNSPGFSLAQESEEMKGSMMSKSMKADMTCKEKMMKMCPMHGKMMAAMMCRSLVATKDGGVVVISGNKLIKYDKNLNVVKEAEIKIDMEDINKMMAQIKRKCPMCKKMMSESEMMEEGSDEELKGSGSSGDSAEHGGHHQ